MWLEMQTDLGTPEVWCVHKCFEWFHKLICATVWVDWIIMPCKWLRSMVCCIPYSSSVVQRGPTKIDYLLRLGPHWPAQLVHYAPDRSTVRNRDRGGGRNEGHERHCKFVLDTPRRDWIVVVIIPGSIPGRGMSFFSSPLLTYKFRDTT